MASHPKIVLLDDDTAVLELYKEVLAKLPSAPEVHTATTGARALALLESGAFDLLISDLEMPRMDGLQVLTIVRRRFPHLRTAVLTGVADDQRRARAYAIGIDIFLEKPKNPKEMAFLQDCIESLLGQEQNTGFRGVQSKSLVDIIQLESLSQSSALLKVTNGPVEGKIWFENGDVIDAEIGELKGEPAFQKIVSWKTGSFELLPPDPNRPRTINTSAQGLLLETAQALDEVHAGEAVQEAANADLGLSPMEAASRIPGVEFLLACSPKAGEKPETWGVEEPEKLAAWTRQTIGYAQWLGEQLQAGKLVRAEAYGPQHHAALAWIGEKELCVGLHRSFSKEKMQEVLKTILSKWVS